MNQGVDKNNFELKVTVKLQKEHILNYLVIYS